MRADAAGARRKSGGGGAWARQQPAAATACDGPSGGDGRAVSVQPRRMRAAPHPHSARDRAIRVHEALVDVVVSFCGGSVAGSSPEIADGAPLMFAYKLCEISQYFHNSKPRRSLGSWSCFFQFLRGSGAVPHAKTRCPTTTHGGKGGRFNRGSSLHISPNFGRTRT